MFLALGQLCLSTNVYWIMLKETPIFRTWIAKSFCICRVVLSLKPLSIQYLLIPIFLISACQDFMEFGFCHFVNWFSHHIYVIFKADENTFSVFVFLWYMGSCSRGAFLDSPQEITLSDCNHSRNQNSLSNIVELTSNLSNGTVSSGPNFTFILQKQCCSVYFYLKLTSLFFLW